MRSSSLPDNIEQAFAHLYRISDYHPDAEQRELLDQIASTTQLGKHDERLSRLNSYRALNEQRFEAIVDSNARDAAMMASTLYVLHAYASGGNAQLSAQELEALLDQAYGRDEQALIDQLEGLYDLLSTFFWAAADETSPY